MATSVGSIEYDARIDTNKMRGDAAQAEGIARSTGDNLGSSMEKGTGRASAALAKMARFAKVAAVLTGAALAAAIGKFVIGGGISRALNIEDAQAKLRGLGHDAKSVGQIMDSALKSVKGTAFGLDAAATAAASAVAAGVKPGKELTRVLALTGDTATIMGRDFGEAGAIINKVLAGNRLSMEEVNQLQDAGLPILSMLGKQYGKTALQMREMVSAGEIDSKRFLKALQTNIGGAALASGNTTRGAWMNMQAAMSRVGAAIVKDIIPRIRDAFGAMTAWFDANSTNIVNAVGRTIEFIKSFASSVVNLGTQVATYLGPKLTALWNTLTTQLIPALSIFYNNYIKPLIPVIGVALVGALGLAIDVLNILTKIVSGIVGWFGQYRMATAVLAGIITTLLLPALTVWIIKLIAMKVQAGITAIANVLAATTSGVAWAVAGAKTWAAWALTFARMIARGAVAAAQAVAQAAKAGAAWVLSSGKASKAVSGLHTLVGKKIPMGPIVIVAALAAIALVMKAVQEVIGAINAMNNAHASIDANSKIEEGSTKQLQNFVKNGTPLQKKNAQRSLKAIANNRATGGPVSLGKTYIVGEEGPEIFTPKTSGNIIPNHELRSSGQSVYITFNMKGIMARSRSELRGITEEMLESVDEKLRAKGLTTIIPRTIS